LTGSGSRRLNEQALDIAVRLALLAAAAGYLIGLFHLAGRSILD